MKKYMINKRVDFMIGLFFILFVVLDIVRGYFYKDISLSGTVGFSETMVLQEWILRLFRDIFLALGLASLVIFGIREMRKTHLTLNKSLAPLVGIMGMLFLFFSIFFVEATIKNMIDGLSYTSHSLETIEERVISSEKKKINNQIEQMSQAKYLWLGLLFASVTIGFATPVKRDEVEF